MEDVAIFTKKPAGGAPPAAPGGAGGWLKLGADCAALRILFDDARRSSAWSNPAFKAYTARITTQPLDLQMNPTERIQAPVVYVSAGGRGSMHGFHVVAQMAGRENLRRLTGSERVNARHFTPEDLKKIQSGAVAAPKSAPPAAKPAPGPARPAAAPAAKSKPGGAADEFTDFFGAADKTKPSAGSKPKPAAPDLGGDLGGDLSDPDASVEEFQSYMASGRAPGEDLPGTPGPTAAPPTSDPAGSDMEELVEAAELAEDIEISPAQDQVSSIPGGEAGDPEWLGGGAPEPSIEEAQEAAPRAGENTTGEPAAAMGVDLGGGEPAAADGAGEEALFGGLDTQGLNGPSETAGVEAAGEDAFAGLDAPAGETAPPPLDLPEGSGGPLPPEPEPTAPHEENLAGEAGGDLASEEGPAPEAEASVSSVTGSTEAGGAPLASRDDFAAAEGPPVSSAESDGGLAGEAADGGVAREAERMAAEVAGEPVPAAVADAPAESAPAAGEPEAPSLGIQYAHDDIQYLGQPPDEAVVPEMARQDLDPTARRARTEPETADEPIGLGDEEIQDAEDYLKEALSAANTAPAAPGGNFLVARIVEKPPRPPSSSDALVDFSADSEIQQALSDAGSVVMTTVERPGEESPAEGGEWIAFTKEASDALKVRAKQAAVVERAADRLVFSLRLQVRFPESEEREGRLCIDQRRPALLCEGEQAARPLGRQCAIRYLP